MGRTTGRRGHLGNSPPSGIDPGIGGGNLPTQHSTDDLGRRGSSGIGTAQGDASTAYFRKRFEFVPAIPNLTVTSFRTLAADGAGAVFKWELRFIAQIYQRAPSTIRRRRVCRGDPRPH
jgi:hypothetical protein